MILIYGKGKVGKGLADLCDYLSLTYEICDDADGVEDFSRYEQIIPSPGIPGTHRIYATGKVVSELDFVSAYMPRGFETIAITGTDGKSTTSWIMYSILEKEYFGKKSVYLSGNFDIPFSMTVLEILKKGEKKGYIVIEVSSFMAHILERFRPDYSIFLNFKPDHLNWHRNLQEYLDAKMHLITRAQKKSIIHEQIISFAHAQGLQIALPGHARIFYHRKERLYRDMTDGESIIISGRKKYSLSETSFSGVHNAMNILASTLVTNEMGICSKRTKRYLSEICGLPHRLENIGEKNGIIFVEDSKSTSAQSLEAALSSYGDTKNLLLIVGGSDKGDRFDHLGPRFAARVRALVCIGATKDLFVSLARENNIPYYETDVLEDGVRWLYDQAVQGDVLMLSPGCASFGLFQDYLHRATVYREAIKKLP